MQGVLSPLIPLKNLMFSKIPVFGLCFAQTKAAQQGGCLLKAVLRVATVADAAAVNETYGYYIAHSLANFGETNITVEERAREMDTLLETYPFFVAEDETGRFLGFACAEPYRSKSGYRFTAELTIYLHPDAPKGAGIGTLLYDKLLSCLKAQGFRVAIGVIHAQNLASIALHRYFGFEQVGYLRHYCYKQHQWVDAVLMDKVLNPFEKEVAEPIPFSQYRRQLEGETLLTRRQAEELLLWAHGHNPGPWLGHSQTAARAACTIANACGMDAELAYLMGLLHDIGRYEGVRGMHHVIAGYNLMMQKGLAPIARICLTHSFPLPEADAYTGPQDCTPQEMDFLKKTLDSIAFNDYDRLIQLCDALSMPDGVSTIEERLFEVSLRHGFTDCTQRKWKAFLDIKKEFDQRCGMNIYQLFREEISQRLFDEKKK